MPCTEQIRERILALVLPCIELYDLAIFSFARTDLVSEEGRCHDLGLLVQNECRELTRVLDSIAYSRIHLVAHRSREDIRHSAAQDYPTAVFVQDLIVGVSVRECILAAREYAVAVDAVIRDYYGLKGSKSND